MRFTRRKANFWESGDICNMSMINCRVRMDFCRWFHAGRKWYKYCEKWRSLLFYCLSSSGPQGQSVGPGEMVRRKFSNTGGRAPGYWLSPDHFQTVKQILAPDWAQKMHCIIVPNRWTDFREFVHNGYYLTTVARFVHQAFLTRQRNYRWVEKCFGCYQREQFNLHWENSVSHGSQCIVNNRKFKMRQRRTRNQKKQ